MPHVCHAVIVGAGCPRSWRERIFHMKWGVVVLSVVLATGRASQVRYSELGGEVTGSLQFAGGPPTQSATGLHPGTVTFTTSLFAKTATVDSHGVYQISLPYGTYQVTGRSPMYLINGNQGTCSAASPVQVHSRELTVNVYCEIK
jgi:hypothetical protein